MVGMGASLLSSRPSDLRGLITGVGGLAIGLYSEWANFPFNADPGLSYFLGHIHTLKPLTLIMILVGTIVAWKWGGEAMRPKFGAPAARD